MKILFTGGGTGGHFYPIIAVAQELRQRFLEEKLIGAKLYFFSNAPYNERALFENEIEFRQISAGKIRRYFSWRNFLDLWRTGWGVIQATWKVFWLYPDVVFAKGGYASIPVLFAARLLRLPMVIHESDSRPGRANLWAGKFATRIAVSYPEAAAYFPAERTAVTGNPLRQEIQNPARQGAYEFLKLDPAVPVIFITGGSQGAQAVNEAILGALPKLVEKYQLIHQVGKENLAEVTDRARVILNNQPQAGRYQIFDYLNETALRMAAGVASLVISRAGSTIFEIAQWGLPSIIIPIPEAVSHDQESNAFTYARTGAAVVIEQHNLSASVLAGEIDRLVTNQALRQQMGESAKKFARPDAGRVIAEELIRLALSHEQ